MLVFWGDNKTWTAIKSISCTIPVKRSRYNVMNSFSLDASQHLINIMTGQVNIAYMQAKENLKPYCFPVNLFPFSSFWVFPESFLSCINKQSATRIIIMWLDLLKGVFHTHSLLWVWRTITWCRINYEPENLAIINFGLCASTLHYKNLSIIAFLSLKLWITKVGYLEMGERSCTNF